MIFTHLWLSYYFHYCIFSSQMAPTVVITAKTMMLREHHQVVEKRGQRELMIQVFVKEYQKWILLQELKFQAYFLRTQVESINFEESVKS